MPIFILQVPCTFLLFMLVIKRAYLGSLPVKAEGGQSGTVLILCKNIFHILSQAQLRLWLSELNKSKCSPFSIIVL